MRRTTRKEPCEFPRYLTCKDAGELLQKPVASIRRMVREGIFPPGIAARLQRIIVLDRDALLQFLAEGGKPLDTRRGNYTKKVRAN